MKYMKGAKELKTLKIPKSCKKFYIHLKHIGQLPAAAMGHNILISKDSDLQELTTKSISAGRDGQYLPNDPRVIAQSHILLGGSAADVKEDFIEVDTSKFEKTSKYKFFCSFPGHNAMMQGDIVF